MVFLSTNHDLQIVASCIPRQQQPALMGASDSRLNFRKAVIQLTTKTQPVESGDEAFWDQFWSENVQTEIQDVFTLIPAAEIRALREECPSNLATLCYKCVANLVNAAEHGCRTQKEQQTVLNCVRLLTRILPYIFEETDWRGFFWSTLPQQLGAGDAETERTPLAQLLLTALCDLLFCPDFTVASSAKKGPDTAEDLQSIDSCEYIWESGVGFAHAPTHIAQHNENRTDILKLLLTCFSDAMYLPPIQEAHTQPNRWIQFFTSADNRHALPLFTSLLNIICAYNPVGYGVPYNHLMFSDSREAMVEVAVQLLIVTLDHGSPSISAGGAGGGGVTISTLAHNDGAAAADHMADNFATDNLFVNYLSRVHREEDFYFILKGLSRLLNNPLIQTYLPNSCKKIQFHQELLVLFWKVCDSNKKFLFYVLKSSDVLEILVPILFHLNDARADQSRVGLMHIGVFILLLLSGERNFGVRLNKPYTVRFPMDIPVFTGTHADFLIIVFHKIITSGHQRLQPLFDCLLTIIVNVSPYLKTLSMVSSNKMLHLLEAFSTPWFLFSNPINHHLVFFLLEIFNNVIQYQFDGNSNLVYTIIRKRQVFHQLANLPMDGTTITRVVNRKQVRKVLKTEARNSPSSSEPSTPMMEGSRPAMDAQPGTLKVSLAATPAIDSMTDKAPAHQGFSEVGAAASAEAPSTAEASVQPQQDVQQQDTEGSESESMAHSATEKLDKDDEVPTRQKTVSESSSVNMSVGESAGWIPTTEWVNTWKSKLPLQTILRLLQVLVPQVEKICVEKGLTDESEILKFLQHGTLVGLLPVPHPILIRKYQPNSGTTMWFRTYMWGVIYLRNVDPPIWYDTDVKLFEIQRV